jgi:hypothetical protein
MKTSELTGAALDWAVAKCEEPCGGYKAWVQADLEKGIVPAGSRYSTDWLSGGPIIERERITIEWEGDPDSWCACITADQEVYGSTALIAAMRCYVASKLGDEIEIPKEMI